MHAVAVDACHRLGQEAGGQVHVLRDLAAEQLVELDLVGRHQRLGVAVVHLELRGRHLRVVLLVREAHRALHLGRGVDEAAERVAGQRVVVAAGRGQLEAAASRGSGARRRGRANRKPSISLAAWQTVPSFLNSSLGVVLEARAQVGRVGEPSREAPRRTSAPCRARTRLRAASRTPASRSRAAGPTRAAARSPRMDEPSKVRLSADFSRNFLS